MTAPHNMTEKGTGLSQRTVLILASLPPDGVTLDMFLDLSEPHRAFSGLSIIIIKA